MSRILILSDNREMLAYVFGLATRKPSANASFTYACSPGGLSDLADTLPGNALREIDVRAEGSALVLAYDLVLSIHCKQLFPPGVVSSVRCVNLHPGFNPYNRGWFPQVFSILNGLPAGATLHEMDAQLDHGRILGQREVELHRWDTSHSAYQRILAAEQALLEKHWDAVCQGTWSASQPSEEGNLNKLRDYRRLCGLDLEEVVTMGQAIDRLRALTHPPYRNAFFVDPVTGRRVYVQISLEPSEPSAGP